MTSINTRVRGYLSGSIAIIKMTYISGSRILELIYQVEQSAIAIATEIVVWMPVSQLIDDSKLIVEKHTEIVT